MSISQVDAWAVGYTTSGETTQTLIEHWDGSAWSVVPSPNPGGSHVNRLSAVTAISADDVWAVGWFLARESQYPQLQGKTLILHWDGATWTHVPSPNLHPFKTNQLYAVSGSSSTDVWAIGQHYMESRFPLSLHWDGNSWTAANSRLHHSDLEQFNTVADIADTNVWAMGTGRAVSEHWNGLRWRFSKAPDFDIVIAASASSPDDIWAIGANSAAHFDGKHWVTVKQRLTNLTAAVDAVSPDFAVIVGQDNAETWDGTRWRIVQTAVPGAALFGVSLDAQGDGWAVGQHQDNALIEHWDGTAFTAS